MAPAQVGDCGALSLRGRWSWVLLVVMLAAVFLVAGCATGVESGTASQSASAHAAESRPRSVAFVPARLKPPGVVVNDEVVLEPLPAGTRGLLPRSRAVAAARRDVNPELAYRAQTAQISDAVPPGVQPVVDRVVVWLVTFTSRHPIDVSQFGKPILASHDTIAVNAHTGAFVTGFFTR